MGKQAYENHTRYYTPHHFVFYPVVFGASAISFGFIFRYPHEALIWAAISLVFLLLAWLSFMVRQHYALTNQNRIVRLEMRYRYYILTGKRFEAFENQLSFGQIAALRFASDNELVRLLQRTLEEDLQPDEIKQSIEHWQADNMRV